MPFPLFESNSIYKILFLKKKRKTNDSIGIHSFIFDTITHYTIIFTHNNYCIIFLKYKNKKQKNMQAWIHQCSNCMYLSDLYVHVDRTVLYYKTLLGDFFLLYNICSGLSMLHMCRMSMKLFSKHNTCYLLYVITI